MKNEIMLYLFFFHHSPNSKPQKGIFVNTYQCTLPIAIAPLAGGLGVKNVAIYYFLLLETFPKFQSLKQIDIKGYAFKTLLKGCVNRKHV